MMDRARSRAARKELTRQYLDTPRPAGVYRVLHRASGYALVGASPDAPAMLNRVRAQLRMGGHPDADLQRHWRSDGADAFDFEVLDLLEPSDDPDHDPADELRLLADLWRDKLGMSPS